MDRDIHFTKCRLIVYYYYYIEDIYTDRQVDIQYTDRLKLKVNKRSGEIFFLQGTEVFNCIAFFSYYMMSWIRTNKQIDFRLYFRKRSLKRMNF